MRRLLVPLLAAALLGAPAVSYAVPEACPPGVAAVQGTQPPYAQIAGWLTESAARHAVPVQVLKAIAYRESEWTQFKDGKVLVSTDHVCGLGIMQVTADDRADAMLLASDPAYNIDEGAKILADKWAVSQQTPPPAEHAPDDPHVLENWFYAACLYNGCTGGDDTYATRIQQLVADPWRRVAIPGITPHMPIGGFSHPRDDVDPAYDFPAAFQARLAEQDFVFYNHTTGVVTKNVKAPVHDDRAAPPVIAYPAGAYGPDGPRVTCTVCGGWRLAEGKGAAGRAHWTLSVTEPNSTLVTWTPPRSGPYDVAAYVPALGAETLAPATYHLGAATQTVDQNAVKNTWVPLGRRTLSAAAPVWLGDHSSVAGVKIVADAVRLSAVPALTVTTTASTLTYGATTTLTARLTHGGAALPGQPVRLYRRSVGTTAWTGIGTYATGSAGTVSLAVKPLRNTEYTARFAAPDARFVSAASGNRRVGVRPKVAAALSRTSVPRGTTVTVSASVSPSHAGQAVYLQRYVSGAWQTAASRTLTGSSTASFGVARPAAGTYHYRVYKPADGDHVKAYSAPLTLKVT